MCDGVCVCDGVCLCDGAMVCVMVVSKSQGNRECIAILGRRSNVARFEEERESDYWGGQGEQ